MTPVFLHFVHYFILFSCRPVLLLMVVWPTSIYLEHRIILSSHTIISRATTICNRDSLLLPKWMLGVIAIYWGIWITAFTIWLLLLENGWHETMTTNSGKFVRRGHRSHRHRWMVSIIIMALIVVFWLRGLCQATWLLIGSLDGLEPVDSRICVDEVTRKSIVIRLWLLKSNWMHRVGHVVFPIGEGLYFTNASWRCQI